MDKLKGLLIESRAVDIKSLAGLLVELHVDQDRKRVHEQEPKSTPEPKRFIIKVHADHHKDGLFNSIRRS